MSYTKRFYEKIQEEKEFLEEYGIIIPENTVGYSRVIRSKYILLHNLLEGYVIPVRPWRCNIESTVFGLVKAILAKKGYRNDIPVVDGMFLEDVKCICITNTSEGLLVDYLFDKPHKDGGDYDVAWTYTFDMDHPDESCEHTVKYEFADEYEYFHRRAGEYKK